MEQSHILDNNTVIENTYTNLYEYNDPDHPNAMSRINEAIQEDFTYDANGNTLSHIFDNGSESKKMIWHESNMMKAINIADAFKGGNSFVVQKNDLFAGGKGFIARGKGFISQ